MKTTRPRGSALLIAVLVVLAVSGLCTLSSSLLHVSSQFVELHEQTADAQRKLDGALEDVLAGLNSTGGETVLRAQHVGFSVDTISSSATALRLHVRVEKRLLDVDLAKNGAQWKLSTYRIVETP
jgi:hypothetical protein